MTRFAKSLSIACLAGLVLASPPALGEGTPDSRLGQVVTYDGGYRRLHDVADELTEKTGVRIGTGRNAEDYRVRDLPITVYAKDIPLITLLRALESANRVTLYSLESNGEKTYRLRVSDEQVRAMRDVRAKEHEWGVAEAEWVWDSILACDGLPDSAFRVEKQSIEHLRIQCGLLKTLGPDVKRRMLGGEPVLIDREWKDAVRDYHPEYEQPAGRGEPTLDEIKRSSVLMWVDDGGDSSLPGLKVRFISEEGVPSHYAGDLMGVGPSWLVMPQPGIVDPPKWPSPPKDPAPPGFSRLSDEPDYRAFADKVTAGRSQPAGSKSAKAAPKWSSALLSTKTKLNLPNDACTLADILRALSKSLGCSIICEDFSSHKRDPLWPRTYDELFQNALKTETTLGEKLIALQNGCQIEWMIDPQSGVIVGRSMFYIPRHENLMPEAVLSALRAKGDGPGLELDDVIDLGRYSEGQTKEWISDSRDLGYIPVIAQSRRPGPQLALLHLYAKLSEDQRRLARSGSGLSLSLLDPAWLSDFLASHGPLGRSVLTSNPISQDLWDKETVAAYAALCDPSSFAALTLRVKQTPGPRHKYVFSLDTPVPGVFPNVEMDGFPVYSPERAEALREKTLS